VHLFPLGTDTDMTTTPNEPVQDPEVVPSGDPSPQKVEPVEPGKAPDDPAGDPEVPHGDPLIDPDDANAEPGQMPESTNPEVGA
jgi:hypothetical protein